MSRIIDAAYRHLWKPGVTPAVTRAGASERWRSGQLDVEDRLKALSEKEDPLERVAATVDFEMFWPGLINALSEPDRSKAGRRSIRC